MDNESNEPQSPDVMTPGEFATLAPSALALPATRHDGWTGEKMVEFCELLAETAVVAEACDQVRMSTQSAYALRRRNPVFAAGWDAALTIARERLADTLLARSIEGNAELIYRDGELVGRREVIDNRLGLAILRRLDRLAETGFATGGPILRFPVASPDRKAGASAIVDGPVDWDLVLDAMRTRNPDDIAGALAALKGNEVDEVDDPPIQPAGEGDDDHYIDLSNRCWKDEIEETWMTSFPPPSGYDDYESGDFGDLDETYERKCTAEEIAILEADQARDRDAFRADEEELRDAWFRMLAEDAKLVPDEEENESGETGA